MLPVIFGIFSPSSHFCQARQKRKLPIKMTGITVLAKALSTIINQWYSSKPFHGIAYSWLWKYATRKIIYESYSKLSKELKNSIKILVGQGVLELMIKTIFWLFWSVTQEPLGLLNFQCYLYFECLGQYPIICIILSFLKSVDNFEIEHKTC